jgi:hypothetical protein
VRDSLRWRGKKGDALYHLFELNTAFIADLEVSPEQHFERLRFVE